MLYTANDCLCFAFYEDFCQVCYPAIFCHILTGGDHQQMAKNKYIKLLTSYSATAGKTFA